MTTGSLTIPAMRRVCYPRHFAAAVEATASARGQITPPIMGAAAFIMVEFLEMPYREILLAALVPMHYLGVFTMVHLEARRLALRGLRRDELPRLWPVLRDHWATLIPLVVLVFIILRGNTPYLAAFSRITGCIVIALLNPRHRLRLADLIDAFQRVKYALAVGAAAAAVGIVVGVVSLTGMRFKLSFHDRPASRSNGAKGSAALLPQGLDLCWRALCVFFDPRADCDRLHPRRAPGSRRIRDMDIILVMVAAPVSDPARP